MSNFSPSEEMAAKFFRVLNGQLGNMPGQHAQAFPTTPIVDLDVDSMDAVELVLEFEDEFGVAITDQEAETLFGSRYDAGAGKKGVPKGTVADIANFILQKKGLPTISDWSSIEAKLKMAA